MNDTIHTNNTRPHLDGLTVVPCTGLHILHMAAHSASPMLGGKMIPDLQLWKRRHREEQKTKASLIRGTDKIAGWEPMEPNCLKRGPARGHVQVGWLEGLSGEWW